MYITESTSTYYTALDVLDYIDCKSHDTEKEHGDQALEELLHLMN